VHEISSGKYIFIEK